MKTKTLLISGILMMMSFQSFAENGEDSFRKKVNSQIMYPSNIETKVDAQVYVEFTVLESREIHIHLIECDNEEIRRSISKQLKNIKVNSENTDVLNKTFRYKFNLEVEK